MALLKTVAGAAGVCLLALSFAQAQTPSAAPPRAITDIIAILDQQKPDSEVVASRRRITESSPPAAANGVKLARFYLRRAQAWASLGDSNASIGDARKGLEAAGQAPIASQLWQVIQSQYMLTSELRQTLEILRQREASLEHTSSGRPQYAQHLSVLGARARVEARLGDFEAAQAALKSMDTLYAKARKESTSEQVELYSGQWREFVDIAWAQYHGIRGAWKEVEQRAASAENAALDARAKRPRWQKGPTDEAMLALINRDIAFLANAKRNQGRLAEAEVDARRALLSQLSSTGKYHPATAALCSVLAGVLRDEGRFQDYEALEQAALDIYRQLGLPEDAGPRVGALGALANASRLQERWSVAAERYAALDRAIATWPPNRAAIARANPGYVLALYNTGHLEKGIAAGRAALEFRRHQFGPRHFETAIAQGNLAIGLALTGRDAEAAADFAFAVPLLTGDLGTDDDSAAPGARQRQTARIVAAYIAQQARISSTDNAGVAADTFVYGDSLRGQSVASAIAASSARVVAGNAALASLARREQDLRQGIAAAILTINGMLALPPSERDDSRVSQLREETARLREQHDKLRTEIGVRFPHYAELINPKPATLAEIQSALHDNETFVSIYLGPDRGFVWAVPKRGAPAFTVVEARAEEIDAKVKKLREALEPSASTLSDIPAFDVGVAHELYALLLKPVERVWQPAQTLVIATNGALASLPLGVLPTQAVTLPAESGAAFAAYRSVPWLARSHALASVPSASAFRTLRSLPSGGSSRAPLVGFGDPLFNKEQARDSQTPIATPLERRSAPKVEGMASATLASLPRLPDTAQELASVASALGSTSDVIKLGIAATEENVRKTDLAHYRVVAFATHGLVPGELDGLTQPALALTAPEIAGGQGNGLLTLEKILTLKLDADWVVLSACNTGAAEGDGAEAASGLGRAFFYAGTRAILLTNWSVHSRSARELVSDLFRRQAQNPELSRAEALRQAELALMDGPGFMDEAGQPVFTYAHPLFWAPYTIMGDGS
jgi:CHAT domain-containing protein